MKCLAIILAASTISATVAGPGKPSLSVNVRDGNFEGIDGLDPSLTWSTTASAAGCDFELGVDTSLSPTTDVMSLPRALWGKVSRDVAGWGLSVRADVEFDDPSLIDFDVRASNSDFGSYKMLASTGGGIGQLEVSKKFEALGGSIKVHPKYNANSSSANVILAYDTGDTGVQVEVSSKSSQKIIISQQITESNRIAPSITTSGDLSLQWEKTLGDGNSITTTLNPNQSVNVKWEDGPWTATFDTPLDGLSMDTINVSVKRKVDFL